MQNNTVISLSGGISGGVADRLIPKVVWGNANGVMTGEDFRRIRVKQF